MSKLYKKVILGSQLTRGCFEAGLSHGIIDAVAGQLM
jgi:hypothetical protein